MPVLTSYPGVYVEEIPSGVHTIAGVTTSSTAFVDFFPQGPMGVPTMVSNFTQFQSVFGGLDQRSEASYGVLQYFLNGGQTAWIVRVAAGSPEPAQVTLSSAGATPAPTLTVTAISPGLWGTYLQVGIDYNVKTSGWFNLVIRQVDSTTNATQVLNSEVYRNLSMAGTDPNYAIGVVNAASSLVRLTELSAALPASTASDVIGPIANPNNSSKAYTPVNDPAHAAADGTVPDAPTLEAGIQTLSRLDPYIFNLLCLPAAVNLVAGGAPDTTNIAAVYAAAASFCDAKRAFLLVDIPAGINSTSSTAATGIVSWLNALETAGLKPDANAAIYFPRLQVADPLSQGRLRNVGASGTVAGIYASTDASRGVWKSPAGIDAGIAGASLAYIMNDADNAAINPLGINALRNFKTYGNVVWGARTLQGADQIGSQWAYIAVRRMALYIEESLFEGLKWVVFEPNDTPLWAQIRLNCTSFLQDLFRQGAFQGSSAASAYFVKCDSETTTQTDIDSGVVNILIGFAPLKPAEFVVLQIQQMAGQAGS